MANKINLRHIKPFYCYFFRRATLPTNERLQLFFKAHRLAPLAMFYGFLFGFFVFYIVKKSHARSGTSDTIHSTHRHTYSQSRMRQLFKNLT